MAFDYSRALEKIPHEPGCYLMKDARDQIVYVGKAKDLNRRVHQYFDGHDSRAFVSMLGDLLARIDVIITSNEREALILEAGLIKKFRPRYNVELKDDKDMPQLRIDHSAPWPRVDLVRRRKKDGAHYFGPFPNAQACRKSLDVINRYFMLRTCRDSAFKNRARPCLQYEIHRCPAPCVYEVNHDAYMQNVRDAEMFLSGKYDDLRGILTKRMLDASEAMAYEQAAIYRDQLRSVDEVCSSQKIVQKNPVNQDFWACEGNDDFRAFVVMAVRNGRLINMQTYESKDKFSSVDDLLSQIMIHHYQCLGEFPNEVVLDASLSQMGDLLSSALSQIAGKKVSTVFPKRGIKFDLLQTAFANAHQQFIQRRTSEEALLERVRKTMHLTRYPHRIECYDISNLQGGQIVAAMVVFIEGRLDATRCRLFKIKNTKGQDDFGSLNEVLLRRLKYLQNAPDLELGCNDQTSDQANDCKRTAVLEDTRSNADDTIDNNKMRLPADDVSEDLARSLPASPREASFSEMPDLLLIDGGHGQVSAVMAAIDEAGMQGAFDVVGIGKSRMQNENDCHNIEHSPERLYYPDEPEPLILDQTDDVILLMAHIRDETHHRAIGFHRRSRESVNMKSRLEDVEGIGPKRRSMLMKAFGSVKEIARQTPEAICEACGISRDLAIRLLEAIADRKG